jgi:hypothetical protein
MNRIRFVLLMMVTILQGGVITSLLSWSDVPQRAQEIFFWFQMACFVLYILCMAIMAVEDE